MSQHALQRPDHNKIINFKIKNKQDPEKHRLQFTQIHASMITAEKNFDVILSTANRIASVFTKFQRSTSFNITGITNLAQDLKTVFAILRRRLRREFGSGSPQPARVAGLHENIPERILQDAYHTICPLTMLLQAVAQSISDLNVHIQSGTKNGGWGAIEPLRKILITMERNLSVTEGDNEHTGLAACIMFHERNSRYVVTSTAPRYQRIAGLQAYAYVLRHNHLNRMRNVLPPQPLARVEQLESYCENLKSVWDKLPKQDRKWTGGPPPIVESVMGCNASFATSGFYMTACLMDHLRFQMSKPELAEEMERNEKNRNVHGPFSCAEWELYITLLSDPDPTEPYAPRCVAMSYGMPKARTWENNKFSQRPSARTETPPRPCPLPAYPKPTAQRVGMGKSSTFANHTQSMRHEAAGQFLLINGNVFSHSNSESKHFEKLPPTFAGYFMVEDQRHVGRASAGDHASESTRWLAVSRRDRTANSSFFYGVVSTRIFCRPTCPGRVARRSNVVFFDDQDQAAKSCYRSCKRCQPCSETWSRGSEGRMLAHCLRDRIVAAVTDGTPWTVEAFARDLGVSGAHLHREFKKHCGVTPKSFGASIKPDTNHKAPSLLNDGVQTEDAPPVDVLGETNDGKPGPHYRDHKETDSTPLCDDSGTSEDQWTDVLDILSFEEFLHFDDD